MHKEDQVTDAMVGTFRTVSQVTKNQYVRFVFIGGG